MRSTTLSSLRPRFSRWTRALTVATLCLVIGGFSAATAQSGGDEKPDMVEINLFGGGSFFRGVSEGLGTKHAPGGAFGIRVTENFWRYVGLEQGFTYSVNNLMFQRPVNAGDPNYGFGSRLYQYSLNPVFHFTPRGSAVRPYVTVGVSALDWRPTDRARAIAKLPENVSRFGATNVRSNLQAGLNYGGGVKFHFSEYIGLRLDARAITSRNPTYGLPDNPGLGGVYIPPATSSPVSRPRPGSTSTSAARRFRRLRPRRRLRRTLAPSTPAASTLAVARSARAAPSRCAPSELPIPPAARSPTSGG
jgi:hypothetical protein